MHIALDLDDVLLDYWTTVKKAFLRDFKSDPGAATDWDKNGVKDWHGWGTPAANVVPVVKDLDGVLAPFVGAVYSDWWDWWEDVGPSEWRKAPAIAGALDGVANLHEAGHRITIVTSKPEWAQAATLDWLATHEVPHAGVVFARRGESKADLSTADLLVDDRPRNVEEWAATGRPAIMFGQPWNRDYTPDSGGTAGAPVHSAGTWAEVVSCIEGCWTNDGTPGIVALINKVAPAEDAAERARDLDIFFPKDDESEDEEPYEEDVVNDQTGGVKGRKLARMDLLPWDCLYRLSEHYGRGARKYEERNWERGYNLSLSLGAIGRHLADLAMGNDLDEDGRPHTMAIAFHAFAIDRFLREGDESLDDRPVLDERVTAPDPSTSA